MALKAKPRARAMDSSLIVKYDQEMNTLYVEVKGRPDITPSELHDQVARELEKVREGFTILADYRFSDAWLLRESSSLLLNTMKQVSRYKPYKVARVFNDRVYGDLLNQMSSIAGFQGETFTDLGKARKYLYS